MARFAQSATTCIFQLRAIVYTLFGASFTIATVWALGTLLLKKLTVPLSRLEAWLLAITTGSTCLSVIVFGLCAVNLAQKGVYLAFGLPMIGLALATSPRRPTPSPKSLHPAWKWLFVVIFIALLALYFRNTATPDRLSVLDRDHGFKEHSLQLPDGLGLLLLPAFAIGRHPAAALVNLAFFSSLLMLTLCYGQRTARPLLGIGAAILTYASTLIGQSTITGALVAVLYIVLSQYDDRVSEAVRATKRTASACIVYATEHSNLVRAAGGIAITAMFCWFARPGLAYYFDRDDIANLGREDSARPLGQMIYRALYALAGLHPLPYHLFCLALLATNIYLLYRLAFALTESKATAMLAALSGSFHSRMESLYTSIGNIYDIGCCTFFLLTLLYYLRLRNHGRDAGLKDHIILAALYLGALNFKEMAATLPAILVCYELIYRGKFRFQVSELRRWLAICILTVITAAYLLRDLLGGLTQAYSPQYSLHRFLESWQTYLGYLFYLFAPFPLVAMLVLCALLLSVAVLMRSRPLIFCCCFILIAPLPVCFIAPRGLNVWYIPFAGWAIYGATLLQSKRRELAAAFLFLTLGALLAIAHTRERSYTFLGNAGGDQTIQRFITQFTASNPSLVPGAHILFLSDPFSPAEWTPVILLRLYYRDPALQIQRVKMPDDQSVIAVSSYDLVLDYRNDRLVPVSTHRVNPDEVRALIAR